MGRLGDDRHTVRALASRIEPTITILACGELRRITARGWCRLIPHWASMHAPPQPQNPMITNYSHTCVCVTHVLTCVCLSSVIQTAVAITPWVIG